MRYLGGKARIASWVADCLNMIIKDKNIIKYIEPFCGSCNVVSRIICNTRIASDIHKPVIEMWQYLQQGGSLPDSLTKEQYYEIKANPSHNWYGFVGHACSFSGKFFAGYASDNTGRNYCKEGKNSTLKKLKNLADVNFYFGDYQDILSSHLDKSPALIYCDIPYKNTTDYGTSFDHKKFYTLCRQLSNQGHVIVVSEYMHNIPYDAVLIDKKETKTQLRRKSGKQEVVEVLFTFLNKNDIPHGDG